jgi:hypothetical protein
MGSFISAPWIPGNFNVVWMAALAELASSKARPCKIEMSFLKMAQQSANNMYLGPD